MAKTDPSFSWKTLTSEHFRVHYHQGEETLAKRAVTLAEDIHTKLLPRMKSQPHDRTHIVLIDALDDANGWATPMPYNLITLYITQPYGDSIFGAASYDDWMRLLITHEYTHIVHLDMRNSLPETLGSIFGNLYFPNMFQPIWMTEGLGVYEETELTSGGRNRSPAADMVLRMATLENNFPDISHAANYTEEWPDGQVPYLFGGSFTAYIANKYGRDKLADLSLQYSGRWLPFLVEDTATKVLSTNYEQLWMDWKKDLTRHYDADKQRLVAQGLSKSQPLTPNTANRGGYYNSSPAWSVDGRQIAYYERNADTHPAIRLMDADGNNDRKLVDNLATSAIAIAWSPDGKGIYYTRIDYVRNSDLYNDIYYYDLGSATEHRLTRDLRARDPSPSPDGGKLIFVANQLGQTRLGTIPFDKTGAADLGQVTWLVAASDLQYESPRFSPDGKRIVVSVRQGDGYKDIWLLDSNGNKVASLTHDRAIDGGAVWSSDGSKIYFSSDRTGIFNLFEYDLGSRKITQLSNVLGGAFSPAVSPDGTRIAYSDYSSRGFDIHTLAMKDAMRQPAAAYRDPYPQVNYGEKPIDAKQSGYNALPTLMPRFWLPNFGYSDYSGHLAGLFTFGMDAVQRHSYTLAALYGPGKQRTWYDLNYLYDGWFPSLTVRARDLDKSYASLLEQRAGFVAESGYVERTRLLEVALEFPLLTLDKQQSLTVGYQRDSVSRLIPIPPWTGYDGAVPAQGILASGRLSYQFLNAKKYGYSISPENGRLVELSYERLDKILGSDYTMKKYSVDWHEYIDMPLPHHVLMLRGYDAKSSGDLIAQRAYQLGGVGPADMLINREDNKVALRGYPVNQYRGQNAALATVEYRMPVQNLERGANNTPIYLKRIHASAFVDAGNTWDDVFRRDDIKRSVGVEGSLDMTLAYWLPVTVRAGLYKALDDQRDRTMVVSIWVTM
jgi:Tol biopolymer transport system component